jgi:hypothetical protein
LVDAHSTRVYLVENGWSKKDIHRQGR